MTNSVPPRGNPAGNAEDKTRKQLIAIIVLLVLIIVMVGTFFFVKVSRDRATVAEGQGTSSASGSGSSGGAAGSGADAAGNAGAAIEERAADIVKVYKEILAAPNPRVLNSEFSVEPLEVGTKTSYALVDLNSDCIPELLLNYGPQPPLYEISAVGVFGVDANGGKVDFGKLYHDGASSAGRARFSVQKATDGSGLIYNHGGATGDTTLKITRADSELVETPGSGSGQQISRTPSGSTGPLDQLSTTPNCAGSEESGQGQPLADGPNPTQSNDAGASGSGAGSGYEDESSGDGTKKTTFTGTVRIFQTDDDLVAYQGIRNPNPGSNMGPYVMLILDSPMQVTAKKSGTQDKYPTRSANMLLLDSGADATGTDGERKTVTYSADELYWQSDTSLPMAEPRVKTW